MKRLLALLMLCLLTLPGFAETLPDQALGFFEDAGIKTDGVFLLGNELTVTFLEGGKASRWSEGDFDPLELTWRFEDVSDETLAAYLNHALGKLAAVEARIPSGENLSAADEIRARSSRAVVGNALLDLENAGEQGLQVLLSQLALHDGSDALNSLRARLASALLGPRDGTNADPALGCAWYDALMISGQNALPLPQAADYIQDDFLAEVNQLVIAHLDTQRRTHPHSGIDMDKAATFVYLSEAAVRRSGGSAVVVAHLAAEDIALFDGARLHTVSGVWAPARLELTRQDGVWTLDKLIWAQDGARYAPSIEAFFDWEGPLMAKIHANALMNANTKQLHDKFDAALLDYLAKAGYPDAARE